MKDKTTEKILDYLYFAIKYDNTEFENKLIEFLNNNYSNDYLIYPVIVDVIKFPLVNFKRKNALAFIVVIPKQYKKSNKFLLLNSHIDKVEIGYPFNYVDDRLPDLNIKTIWNKLDNFVNIVISESKKYLKRIDGNPIGGDDRCGVAIMLYLLDKHRDKQNIIGIFTNYEEINFSGARKFRDLYDYGHYNIELSNILHYIRKNKELILIGLDRRGKKHFVI